MKILPIALSAALFSLAAVAYAASPSDDDVSVDASVPCEGCEFINANHPANPDATLNPCQTELKLTVFGLSGACEREEPTASCVPASDCWALMVVDYKSNCDVKLTTFPFGVPTAIVSGPPSSAWRTLASKFSIMGCGSPAEFGYVELRDTGGHKITNSYKYHCAGCR